MKFITIIGLLRFLILSCNNSKKEKVDERKISKDSLRVDTVDFPTKIEAPKIDTLARIELENNASVKASADDVKKIAEKMVVYINEYRAEQGVQSANVLSGLTHVFLCIFFLTHSFRNFPNFTSGYLFCQWI